MALRKILSKAILPNLGQDLGRSLTAELKCCANMVDNMLAPQVYAFKNNQFHRLGAFRTGERLHAPVMKVNIPVKQEGLFKDMPSWH
jgi:hypothetical protein